MFQILLDMVDLLVVFLVAPKLRGSPTRIGLMEALVCAEHVVAVEVERAVDRDHVLKLRWLRRLVVALHYKRLPVARVDGDGFVRRRRWRKAVGPDGKAGICAKVSLGPARAAGGRGRGTLLLKRRAGGGTGEAGRCSKSYAHLCPRRIKRPTHVQAA